MKRVLNIVLKNILIEMFLQKTKQENGFEMKNERITTVLSFNLKV